MYDTDVIVIGAGAVGLACGAAFARRGDDVFVLEAADAIGTGVSSRNSEVIHGGMYYPTGSLRHRFCVEGRRRLYQYMGERGVAHARFGKLIVATSDAEAKKIETIYKTGLANGVENLTLLDGRDAMAMEPELTCTAAVMSPETGVIDSHGYMLALQGEIEDHGGVVVFRTPVVRIESIAGGFRVATGGDQPGSITCRRLVNSAGLHAQTVAKGIDALAPDFIPKQTLAKGNYYSFAGRPAFTHLIYPAPVEGGLGVHVTLDLAGRMRFGPDVEWLKDLGPDEVDYTVDPRRSDSFYAAIRTYWPGLRDGQLQPDYSGCRPKLSGPGEPAQDFRIDGPEVHSLSGLVNLFGIESPGLTSSPAIAEEVVRRLAN
jgi:L-2-hydroxyglutarate oxidase LhgO